MWKPTTVSAKSQRQLIERQLQSLSTLQNWIRAIHESANGISADADGKSRRVVP